MCGLGMSTLCLKPIFEALTNHRCDTTVDADLVGGFLLGRGAHVIQASTQSANRTSMMICGVFPSAVPRM